MLNSETAQTVTTGGVASVAILFLQQSLSRMIPYSLPALALIILDLVYGVKAAKARGERVRFSTGLKKTVSKAFAYICWIIVASSMAVSFEREWIEWVVLGLVFTNEIASIVGNYLETKGVELSLKNLYKWLFRKAGEKTGFEVSQEDADSIIKDKKKDDK